MGFVAMLFIPAIRHKAKLSIFLLSFTLFMHIFTLMGFEFVHSVPGSAIKVGALTLALDGFRIKSISIAFAGTYSFLSKLDYRHLSGSAAVANLSAGNYELLKLAVSVFVFSAVYFTLYYGLSNKTRRTIRKRLGYRVISMSERHLGQQVSEPQFVL